MDMNRELKRSCANVRAGTKMIAKSRFSWLVLAIKVLLLTRPYFRSVTSYTVSPAVACKWEQCFSNNIF